MGLVGFLVFVFKCIQLLAWPSFALGYPLCVSIRAMETNSNHQMRKLVTYWILFSLMFLFEHTFSKLLQWVPVWPYVKTMAIFWLVIPRFNGASIAYRHLVRPCFSLQLLQSVLDLLNKKQDLSQEGESFLVVAERYVSKNGTEALEKLIARKPKIKEPTVAQSDIKALEIRDEIATTAENKTTTNTNADIEVRIIRSSYKDVLLETSYNDVQEEGTCAVCQVTTHSEATLNSHLQGMKHEAKVAELEATEQTTKNICNTTKSDQANKDPKKTLPSKGPNNKFGCDLCQVILQSEATLKSHLQGAKHKSKCEQLTAKETTEKNKTSSSTKNSEKANRSSTRSDPAGGLNKDLTIAVMIKVEANVNNGNHSCSKCNVTCINKSGMASHLRGKRHLSQIEKSAQSSLVHYWCNICDVIFKSNIDMSSHLYGTKHASRLDESH